ncbi:MAG: sensor histidine kinase [Candidatus Nanopelagicales bacterium]
MTGRLRALWTTPAADGAIGPGPRDWLLVAALLVATALEGALRSDVTWRPVAVALAVVIVACLPWRRVRPTACVAVAFGGIVLVQAASLVLGTATSVGLISSACVLLVAYAAVRWGSGRAVALLLALLVPLVLLGRGRDWRSPADIVAELVVLSLPIAVALAVRAQATSRSRELERVRASERVQLARDLHDTVAHHVSAMVVRAQAGRVVAATDPAAAVDALRLIEEEGSRTLREMRAIVGALRDGIGDGPEVAPTASLRDVEGLSRPAGGGPAVTVTIDADADDVNPAVAAALYRIAQESVTNALRHAEGAARIDVRVTEDGARIRLRVTDDGAPPPSTGAGFGIVGMRERAALLGGSVEAGPASGGGWVVDAVLPTTGEGR